MDTLNRHHVGDESIGESCACERFSSEGKVPLVCDVCFTTRLGGTGVETASRLLRLKELHNQYSEWGLHEMMC